MQDFERGSEVIAEMEDPGSRNYPPSCSGLLALIFDSVQDPLALLDATGRIMHANPTMAKGFGLAAERLTGRRLREFLHPADANALGALAGDPTRAADREAIEGRFVSEKGRPLWLLCRLRTIPAAAPGEPAFLLAMRDITAQREAEELTRIKAEHARTLEQVVRRSPAVAYRAGHGAKRPLLYISDNVGRFGYQPREFSWGGLSWSEIVHPDDAENFLAKAADTERLRSSGAMQYRIITRDKRVRWVEDSFWPADANLEEASVEGMLFDITRRREAEDALQRSLATLEERVRERTWALAEANARLSGEIVERKQAERQLLAAKEAAEAVSEAKSAFLANMSHELRTPMHAVLGFTAMLMEDEDDPSRRECLELAHASGETLLTLIDDILDFSKIEAGKIEIEPRDFSLRALLRGIVRELAPIAERKGLAISIEVDDSLQDAQRTDDRRLRQILVNLVGNAIKFTEHGEIRILAAAEPLEGMSREIAPPPARPLYFSVVDTGIGIATDKLTLIFDRFTQADTSLTKKYAGTGLGLAISKRLAELLGGRVAVRSEPSKGSAFSFSILTEPAENPNELAERCEPRSKSAGPHCRSLKVLLAEDNPVNRTLAEMLLMRRGHVVRSAENGEVALELLAQEHFDLVLMDIQMPIMDGLTATSRIRQGLPSVPKDIPVIGLSAYAMKGDRERFIAAGMDGYISKPFRLDEFDRVMRRMAREFQARESRQPLKPRTEGKAPGVMRLLSQGLSQKVVGRLLGECMEDIPEKFAGMERAMAEARLEDASLRAHSLAGIAATLGAADLRATAIGIEEALRHDAPDKARALIPEARHLTDELLDELRAMEQELTAQSGED